MKIYHGSYLEVSKPDILQSRLNVDFGKGFYATPLKQQALQWSKKFKNRYSNGVVSHYKLDEDKLCNFTIKRFETYSEEWLDFVLMCRSRTDISEFDVVIGGVANFS